MPLSFDDLIPQQNRGAPAQRPGLSFDDLIPQAPAAAPAMTQAAAPAPAVEQSGPGSIEGATYLAQRGSRGVADALGAPVDIATMGINAGLSGADLLARLFGGSVDTRIEKPFMGSDWIADRAEDVYEATGREVVPEENVTQGTRYAGEAARFGTAAAIPSFGLAAQGQRAGTSIVDRSLNTLSKPYRAAPGRVVAGDIGGGVGAGLAMEGYEDAVPESAKDMLGPLGPIGAAIVGGVGGAYGTALPMSAARGTVERGRNVLRGNLDPDAPVNPATGERHTRSDMDMAARITQNMPSNRPQAVANIEDGQQQFSQFANRTQTPTTAMLADDIGMSIEENNARARNAKPFVERDTARRVLADERIDASVPRDANSRDFTNRATQIYDDTIGTAQRGLDDAEARQATARADLDRQASEIGEYRTRQGEASARLAGEFDQQYRGARDRKNALYNAPDDSTNVPGEELYEAMQEVEASVPRAARAGTDYSTMSSRIRDLMEDVDPETGDRSIRDLTYGDMKVLRADVSAMRKEAVAAGRDVSYLDGIGRVLNERIDEINPEARQFYAEEYAPRFKTGRAGEYEAQLKRANRTGEESSGTRPSEFGDKFLRKPEDAASLQRAIDVNGNPVTAASARDWMLGDLARSNVLSGDVDIRYDRFKTWADKNKAVIDQFPEIRSTIDAELNRAAEGGRISRELGAEVASARTNLRKTTTDMNSSAFRAAIGNSPENAVAKVMGGGDPERQMGQLVEGLSGDPAALDGLKAATRDWIKQKTATTARNVGDPDSMRVSRASLEKMMRSNDKALAQLYSPEEMQALQQARQLMAGEASLDVRATAGSNTVDKYLAAQKGSVASRKRMLEAGLKAKFGILKGGGIFRTINLLLDTLPNNEQALTSIIDDMWTNPDLAVHLMTRPVKEIGTDAWNAKLNRLLAAAAGGRSYGEDTVLDPIDVGADAALDVEN